MKDKLTLALVWTLPKVIRGLWFIVMYPRWDLVPF